VTRNLPRCRRPPSNFGATTAGMKRGKMMQGPPNKVYFEGDVVAPSLTGSLGDLTLDRETKIWPGQREVRLDTTADKIEVTHCKIDGDTVPFNFDSKTGTLDLPKDLPGRLRGRPVTIAYTTKISDPESIRHTYQKIERLEIERRKMSPPAPEPRRRRVVLGNAGAGPYRSSEIVCYEKPTRGPWYVQLWRWLMRRFR